jgi:hypothetical protein
VALQSGAFFFINLPTINRTTKNKSNERREKSNGREIKRQKKKKRSITRSHLSGTAGGGN